MTKKVLVPLADGSEEIEAVAVIDILRRAGADVTVASVAGLQVVCSRGVKIEADRLLSDCTQEIYDLIVLPGGMPGAEHLRDCKELAQLLKDQRAAGRLYAAICASPAVVFQPLGLLQGKKATCHPGRLHSLENKEAAADRVVVDGNCITSQAPGTAIEFALTLVELLFGKEQAAAAAGPLVIK